MVMKIPSCIQRKILIRFASMTMIEGGLGRAYSASLAWEALLPFLLE